jgi:hypothetical protein
VRAGLTNGGAEAPAKGPEGVRTPGLVSPVGSEERTLGARLGHVRFAPIPAVPRAEGSSRKRTFVQLAQPTSGSDLAGHAICNRADTHSSRCGEPLRPTCGRGGGRLFKITAAEVGSRQSLW